MNFKATIGESELMDVSAPDFDTAVSFVRSEAKGEAFSVATLDGQSFIIEPNAEVMAEIQRQIDFENLCPACCFRLRLQDCKLCRKCNTENWTEVVPTEAEMWAEWEAKQKTREAERDLVHMAEHF